MKRVLLLVLVLMSVVGCRRVSVQVQNQDEDIRFAVPFGLAKTVLRFTEDETLDLGEFAGGDQEIDLRLLAKALHEQGDQVKIKIEDGDSLIQGRVVRNVFRVEIDEPEENTRVTVNLPMTLMAEFAENDGKVRPSELMDSLRKYRGVLIHVDSPDEQVKITMK